MTTRIYLAQKLQTGASVILPPEPSHHLAQVLRARVDEQIILFDGQGNSALAELKELSKRQVTVTITDIIREDRESNLNLHLYQAVSRGKKMDLTIQKSVELGVTEITPIISERCGVKLSDDRWEKRQQHWQGVIISACEQSGRAYLPRLNPILDIQAVAQEVKGPSVTLAPTATTKLKDLQATASLNLLVGPEGGFSADEIKMLEQQGVQSINLGPRILRTETAALVAISIIQNLWGDL